MPITRHAFVLVAAGLALGCGSSVSALNADAGSAPVDTGAVATDAPAPVDVANDAGVSDVGTTDVGTADGSVSPDAAVCSGASIGVNGMYCAGPADGPLPLDCCSGWDCNSAHALCNLAPPPCEPGYVHLIAGGCFGDCVRADHCRAP